MARTMNGMASGFGASGTSTNQLPWNAAAKSTARPIPRRPARREAPAAPATYPKLPKE